MRGVAEDMIERLSRLAFLRTRSVHTEMESVQCASNASTGLSTAAAFKAQGVHLQKVPSPTTANTEHFR